MTHNERNSSSNGSRDNNRSTSSLLNTTFKNDKLTSFSKTSAPPARQPPVPTFEFVNVAPGSEVERQRNQRVVRSAAMKTFRRDQQLQKQQQRTDKSGKAPPPERAATWSGPPGSRDVVSEANSTLVWQDADSLWSDSSSESSDGDLRALGPVDNRVTAVGLLLVSPQTQGSSMIGSPLNFLGGGRCDPFRVYPVDMDGPHINDIIDHCVTLLWPGLLPSPLGSESRIASIWLEKVLATPIVMHALIFGGAAHMDVLRTPQSSLYNPIRLYHKVQTIKLLKESLTIPETIPLDDIILSILCLGYSEVETMALNTRQQVPSPFNSPLTSLQWLDVYGRIANVRAHTEGMRSLVARRGGLKKIELFGLAEILSFSDILSATQSLKKPHWKFLERNPQSQQPYEALGLPRGDLGTALVALAPDAITRDAAGVLHDMAELTAVIECHVRAVQPIADMCAFIDRRNSIQHNLMSLPAGEELRLGEVSSIPIYEAIRYAAMIYSAAVVFPLPPLQGVFGKLACRLKAVLQESKFDPAWNLYLKTLMWVLVLGGIAALETVERQWYVRILASVSSCSNVSGWEDVVEGLQAYLWLESACEAGGRKLWEEVVREGGRSSEIMQVEAESTANIDMYKLPEK